MCSSLARLDSELLPRLIYHVCNLELILCLINYSLGFQSFINKNQMFESTYIDWFPKRGENLTILPKLLLKPLYL